MSFEKALSLLKKSAPFCRVHELLGNLIHVKMSGAAPDVL
jgi:hypothetical protein